MDSVYISYSIPYEHLAYEVSKIVEEKGYEAHYWKMGTDYGDNLLVLADKVVFILKDYYWSMHIADMTRGIKSEVEKAYKNNTEMYVAYKRQDGIVQVYKATFDGETLSAVRNSYLESPRTIKYELEETKPTKRKLRHK